MQAKLQQQAMMDEAPSSPSMEGANINEHHGVVLFSGFGLNGPFSNATAVKSEIANTQTTERE